MRVLYFLSCVFAGGGRTYWSSSTCVGGVAHPPGYGLWLELAAAAFAADPTRAARRASLMSALRGAAAAPRAGFLLGQVPERKKYGEGERRQRFECQQMGLHHILGVHFL